MKRYRRSLPPLDGLIFFEAAARHHSFSAAAEELLVTQTAVSKRIRQLEDHLGVALFLRSGRVIELTDEGRRLAEQSAILLDFTEAALASVASRPDAPVRIAANSAVSLFWLSQRLKGFGLSDRACPVELVSSDLPAALLDDANDIAILHGSGRWRGRAAIPLLPDVLVPVISPGLAQQASIGAGQSISLLEPEKRPPLLNFPRITPDWTNWDNWGNTLEVKGWPRTECGTFARSIGAALEGAGIALASPHILSAELASGQLLQLSPVAQSSQHAYFLTYSDERHLRPDAKRLVDYLAGNAG
ncbi:LysR family transcriptional regulator [Leisingera sp. D0M16]|uniref:LysR family transcriptional regulator n=1 Tax=Leisingera coralii TaxID=3351347 RepID=UPI003B7A96EF